MNCQQCGDEFVPARATARFCSPKCRVAAGRKTVTLSPDEPVTLTDGKAVTSDDAEAVTLTAGVRPPRVTDKTGQPRGYDGEHAGHDVFPHRHVPVDGVTKGCSGRWSCTTCSTWFSGTPCA